MSKPGEVWVPPTGPGEEKWVWDYFSSVPVQYPTKHGHWARVCPNGTLEEMHWDPDHASGKPNRWKYRDCEGQWWDRPFDSETYGNEWRDDRWWETSGGLDAAGHDAATEYLSYCTAAAPSLARLVAEALDLSRGSFDVTVPFVVEPDGGWNTAGRPDDGDDYRDAVVSLLSDFLTRPSACAVLMGPSLPASVAERHSDSRGVLAAFTRRFGDRTEEHWTLPGAAADVDSIRHAVRFTSSFVFDMGLLLDADLRELTNRRTMGQELPALVAEHTAAFYVHGPSYDGYLVWRKA